MRRFICLVIVINVLLICMPGRLYCYTTDSNLERDKLKLEQRDNPKLEMDWDYLTHVHFHDRYIDTASLHTRENFEKK